MDSPAIHNAGRQIWGSLPLDDVAQEYFGCRAILSFRNPQHIAQGQLPSFARHTLLQQGRLEGVRKEAVGSKGREKSDGKNTKPSS